MLPGTQMGIGIAALVLGGDTTRPFERRPVMKWGTNGVRRSTSAMEKFKWSAGNRKDGDHDFEGLGFMIINNSSIDNFMLMVFA